MPDIDTTEAKKMADLLAKMEKPPLRFNFPEGVDKDSIKMTYGLEMDIRRMLPDPETAMSLLLADPYTQDWVLRRILTDKNKMITDPEELIPYEDIDLPSEVTEELLMWAAQHAIYFFAKRTLNVANLGVRFAEVMAAATPPAPSPAGSTTSDSRTQSAGDLESQKTS